MASLSSPSGPLTRFALWLAERMNHAFVNPREEGAHLPPPWWGVQPYRDRTRLRLPLNSASAPIPRPSKLR